MRVNVYGIYLKEGLMFKQFVVFFSLALLLIACQPSEDLVMTNAERQEIATAVKERSNEMLEMNMKDEFDRALTFWADSSDESWMGNPGLMVQGIYVIPDKESFEKAFRPMSENRTSTNFTIAKDYTSVVSADCAIYVTQGTYSITNLEGETGPEYPWTSTAVWVKRDGEWKILHYHQSWRDYPVETEEEK
jgi:ketosteroid isomerase-like protein